ncbi:glycoside hydrolase family 127 protein [Flavobacterium sp. LHD-80]|uniref:beta-L-arabinofuranosidase domain-containing protein n=1 Tax=Flavobacterium sp. LHD-80 TaxID=3071411 RepID=UPI0027E1223D|nr:beta-L-arabinofuranosidase domain-containing protein [Flavobacterium sp. LHD-80]MDQ6473008.1 glycoside hydrolase family 127 protein [Flavobacterium sp. LHD-80]
MKNKLIKALLLSSAFTISAQQKNKYIVKETGPNVWMDFPLNDTRLLENSPFYHAMKLDQKYLLGMDVNRMLNGYRKRANLPLLGNYPGSNQPENTRPGEMPHYISGIALMYAQTGDLEYKKRVDYMMASLKESIDIINKNNPDQNYILGRKNWDNPLHELSKGKITLDGGDETNYPWGGMGNFWYVVHKDLAAYRDCYIYCNSEIAFELLKNEGSRIADFALKANPDLFDDMLDIEHGGMNEVFADLYALTGEKKYMETSMKFNHQKVILNTALGNDVLYGRHVNMQVPTFAGTARQYQLDGNKISKEATFNFLDQMYTQHNHVIGGSGRYERYVKPGDETKGLGFTSDETCATYNMLKTARTAFEVSGDLKHLDYFERALYNHILASQDPDSGGVTYYTSLMPGGFKSYSDGYNLEKVWCCVGTGMENHAKYGESVFFHNNDDLFLNLFIPTTLKWEEKGLEISLKTNFPEEDIINLEINENKSFSNKLVVRYPSWAGKVKVWINDKEVSVNGKAGGTFELTNNWKKDDKIKIEMPQNFWIEKSKDEKNLITIMRGPLVMGASLGKDKMPGSDLVNYAMHYNNWVTPQNDIPSIIASESDINKWILPVEGKKLEFKTKGAGFLNGKANEITLIPFYQMHHQRYSVYLKMFSKEELKERQQIVSDEIDISSESDEKKHKLTANNSARILEKDGRHFWENNRYGRNALKNDSFSYEVKANEKASKQFLTVTFWGSASDGNGISIYADDQLLSTEDLGEKLPLSYYEKSFELPESLKGKKNVKITFKVPENYNAGAIYGLKLSSDISKFKGYLFY